MKIYEIHQQREKRKKTERTRRGLDVQQDQSFELFGKSFRY